MKDKRDRAYEGMYIAYLKNEAAYWRWAEQMKLFNQREKERYYYRKGINREKRKVWIEKVIADFPNASLREVHSQTGGCREIVKELGEGLIKYDDDPYWEEAWHKWFLLKQLKFDPDQIYDAIEETYKWSIEIGVRTSKIEEWIPEILEDIGKNLV